MNTRGLTRHPVSILLIACAIFSLLLSACQPANDPTSIPPEPPTATEPAAQPPTQAPADTAVPQATQPPAETTQPPASLSGELTLDLTGVAQGQAVETVAAVPASAGGSWWEVGPEYQRVTFEGYPVTNHSNQPQVFIYPVADLLGASEVAGQATAGQEAADLQALLQARQPLDTMPFLPLSNNVQAMHAQVQYLEFQNGSGVRFLTQFNQGPVPVNSFQLMYTFQGLTSDGQYYIAAVLPVTHPDLPSTNEVTAQEPDDLNNFTAKMAETAAWLDQQPSSSFTPDLAVLDAMVQSIEVK